MKDSEQILTIMIEAAESSAKIIRSNFRQKHQVKNKTSHLDIVTQTDHDSQQNIHQYLINAMKNLGYDEEDIGFIEEESTTDDIRKYNFIVDPIDGTTNFASGIPISCISIGFARGTEINTGVVLDPMSETIYWAVKDQGAFVKTNLRGEQKIEQTKKEMKNWIVTAHLNDVDVADSQFDLYKRVYPQVRGMRNLGSLSLELCMMADDVVDVVFNKGCYLWDLAAVRVIMNEAGGEIYGLDGQPLEFDWQDTKKKYHLFACHKDLSEKVLALL